MSSLRTRFGILVGVLLAASVVLHVLAISSAESSFNGDGTSSQPSLAVPTIVSTLATFCVASAVVLVVGIVATYVIDEALLRRLEIDAELEGDDSAVSAGPAAYGSDPEKL